MLGPEDEHSYASVPQCLLLEPVGDGFITDVELLLPRSSLEPARCIVTVPFCRAVAAMSLAACVVGVYFAGRCIPTLWSDGMSKHSGDGAFEQLLEVSCHTATTGEPCYDAVVWAMNTGIYAHPEWYGDLNGESSSLDFQEHLAHQRSHGCSPPCHPKSLIPLEGLHRRRRCVEDDCKPASMNSFEATMAKISSGTAREAENNAIQSTSTTASTRSVELPKPILLPFQIVGNGTCVEAGLLPINYQLTCEVAAGMLGVRERTVRLTDNPSRPEGCYMFQTDSSQMLWMSTNPETRGRGSERVRQVICMRDAPLLEPDQYATQDGAAIQSGNDVRLYAVGSSNLVWMNWIDQLHLQLKRLGYSVPLVPAKTIMSLTRPRSVPTCDDSAYSMHLETARLGMVGWNSWDFAYDDWSLCDEDDFRHTNGHRVKCGVGPGCKGGKFLVESASIAEDAAKSNVTIITTWFNDHKAFRQNFDCFGGEHIEKENTSQVSIPNLLNLVREIHTKNPHVWILIMGQYPSTVNFQVREADLPWMMRLNAMVKAAVEKEPRTLFVDYEIPAGGLEMYDRVHWGHPNCRGAKLMVQAAIQRLYEAKVLARGIKLEDPARNKVNPHCEELSGAACSTSALCWLDPAQGKCKAYSIGNRRFHRSPTSTTTTTLSTTTTSISSTTTTTQAASIFAAVSAFWR